MKKEADEAGWKPLGVRGTWWHETLRALGAIDSLPLVVTRLAYLYGPNTISTEGMFLSHIECTREVVPGRSSRNDHSHSHCCTDIDIRRVFVQAD